MDACASARIIASYPLDAEHVILRLSDQPNRRDDASYSLASGLVVRDSAISVRVPDRVVLTVEPMAAVPLTLDHAIVHTSDGPVFGPPFAHGPLSAIELKVPHVEPRFPFASRLAGVHVTVACCTGCDGGVHDRGLVVVNDHLGGGWSGLWVRTPQHLEGPYPRWQRMVFAGGVVHDYGSTEVVDHGWMEIAKGDEPAHHPPPPLPVASSDVPAGHTTSLRTKSLDGSWVEFSDVVVEDAQRVDPSSHHGAGRLPYTEIGFCDQSGVRAAAYLFQEQRHMIEAGTHIAWLRGFVHAAKPGEYVLLTDKPEDIQL